MPGFWKSGEEGEAQIAQLKELVSQGLSFSQIANVMKAPTRSMVLGKYHRLRKEDPTLQQHPNSLLQINRVKRPEPLKKAEKVKALPVVAESELVPLRAEDGGPVNIFNIKPKQCGYPFGDPGDADFHYCGHPVREGSHYCEPHHVRCYQAKTSYRDYKDKVNHRGGKRN